MKLYPLAMTCADPLIIEGTPPQMSASDKEGTVD